MNKVVLLQTLPRRKRERQTFRSRKENLDREETNPPTFSQGPPLFYICEGGKIVGVTAFDQDGDPFGTVDPVGDFISANDFSAGSIVYTVATRITPDTYDLPSNAKWILSVAIETLPTLKYTFVAPITIRFPAALLASSEVYVRYVTT